jgi:hypothetical protein
VKCSDVRIGEIRKGVEDVGGDSNFEDVSETLPMILILLTADGSNDSKGDADADDGIIFVGCDDAGDCLMGSGLIEVKAEEVGDDCDDPNGRIEL